MATAHEDFESLMLNRLGALEQRHRRLKMVTLGLLPVVALAVLLCTYLTVRAENRFQRPRTVEAERFILRDEDGKMRAEMVADPSMSSLSLYDRAGLMRASLSVNTGGGAALFLFDENDKARVSIYAYKDGANLDLHDETGARRVRLANEKKDASLRFYDESGKLLSSAP